ncbi:hypothetical protein TWF696_006315 [Orbilia brochopaga]|uniref:HNH nuclease domain-containing protein n=1 Tax=Orbilia brochopaga TaxID=3140254 RepID=A0AAV9UW05_9PEZI
MSTSWYSFQVDGCRHQHHQSTQALTFAFPRDEAGSSSGGVVKIDLVSPLGSPQDFHIRQRAVLWLDQWKNATTPPDDSQRIAFPHYDTSTEPENADIEAYLAAKKKRASTYGYDRPTFLRILYDECPSPVGRNNFALEICLTVIPTSSSTESRKISTVTDILALSEFKFPTAQSTSGFNELAKLADELLLCMIQPLRSFGSKTPAISSVDSGPEGSRPSADQDTAVRLSSLQKKVRKRDGYRCVMTGKLLVDLSDMYTSEEVKVRGLSFGVIKCAHIIPHMLNEVPNRLELADEKRQFWSLLNLYSPGTSDSLNAEKIDTPSNALMLCSEAREAFSELKIWLRNIDGTYGAAEPVYTIECVDHGRITSPFWLSENRIVLKSREGVPLPDPYLLNLHRALAMAASLSGAGEMLDVFMDEWFRPDVLASDGSDAGFLEARLRLLGACM